MAVEVYFSRPGENNEISDRIVTDIKYAKKRILMAMAFLTDVNVLQAIEHSPVHKRFIFNTIHVDDKGIPAAIDLFHKYQKRNLAVDVGKRDEIKQQNHSFMHHKFVIIDHILWIGSYNCSEAAKTTHWENMLRITNPALIEQYVREFQMMFRFSLAFPEQPIDHSLCQECGEVVNDPLLHYKMHAEEISYGEPIIYGTCNSSNLPQTSICSTCHHEVPVHELTTIQKLPNKTNGASEIEHLCLQCLFTELDNQKNPK